MVQFTLNIYKLDFLVIMVLELVFAMYFFVIEI